MHSRFSKETILEMKLLRSNGYLYKDIATHFGISVSHAAYLIDDKIRERQHHRMYFINKKYYEKNKEHIKILVKNSPYALSHKKDNYKIRSPDHRRGISAIRNMVQSRKIPSARTLKCSWCHNPATEYHHHKGYNKKYILDVIPLCRKCHVSTFIRKVNNFI